MRSPGACCRPCATLFIRDAEQEKPMKPRRCKKADRTAAVFHERWRPTAWSKRRYISIVGSIGIVCATAGCAGPPGLDDAQLTAVRLATMEDLARHSQADAEVSRRLFRGATIRNPQKGTITFGEEDYDAYRQYLHEHPASIPGEATSRLRLPTLRISFVTSRMLIEPSASETSAVHGAAYFCDDGHPLKDRLARVSVMWRGRHVTTEIARDIGRALITAGQEYEIFVLYSHWDRRSGRPGMTTATLLPPANDLCFALLTEGYPLPSTAGQPLRVDRSAVAAALGPLPREISIARGDRPL
jgi:hypothetical protein